MTTPAPPPAEPVVTLYRPAGPEELALVRESGWRAWPPRLPEQHIFYPVLSEEYATKIARDWNVPHSGAGYVTRFKVSKAFLDKYQIHQAGGQTILEYWIPPRTSPSSMPASSAPSRSSRPTPRQPPAAMRAHIATGHRSGPST